MEYKYICVGKCLELDAYNEPRCKCIDPDKAYERYPDRCPCGNTPVWITLEEYNERNK